MISALWVLLTTTALAQTEACPGALTPEFWRESMDAVDAAMAEFNGERAANLLDDLVYELRCLDQPVDPRDLGRLARQRSLLSFYQQDSMEVENWAMLARDTIGGAPWPPEVPIPDTYFKALEALPPTEVVEVEGQGIAAPKKGAVLLDGSLLVQPRAALGMSHLVQVADRKGVVSETRWQHGAAFPDAVLGEPTDVKVPRWYEAPPAPVAPAATEPEPVAVPVPQPELVEPELVEPEVVEPEVPQDAVVDASTRDRMFRSREATEGCPWKKDPKVVDLSRSTIQINRHAYAIGTRTDQADFRKVLRSCGEFRAARRFERWRDARRHWSLKASRYKRTMVRALLTEEPPRPGRQEP